MNLTSNSRTSLIGNKISLNKLRLYSSKNCREAYLIRDFLKRSVVTFDWIDIENYAVSPESFHVSSLSHVKFPVVELPCGELLYSPTITEIACKLGWVTKPKSKEYDLSIFGAGPAGLSAAVYAASEGLNTVLVEREAIGGQAGTSSMIENYLGFPNGVTGTELAERARQQAVKFGVEILLIRKGHKAQFIDNKLHVDLIDGSKIISKSNICATGVEYSLLNIEGEGQFLNRGVYYGAGASEAHLCRGEHVFIVGGGNSAGQAALNFARHAKRVTIVIRGNDLTSSLSYYLLNRVLNKKNIDILFNSHIISFGGEKHLREIIIANTIDGRFAHYCTGFVFVCIGGVPNTEWAKNTEITRDAAGYIVTGAEIFKFRGLDSWGLTRPPAFLETSVPGCFAAGDVRHNSIKRVASAVGEGAMAVTFVHRYLHENY